MDHNQSGPELSAIADFLSQCLPFKDLPDPIFNSVVNRLSVSYFRRGHFFRAGGADDGLRIVRSGAVEIRGENEVLLDRLGEGESFCIAGLSEEEPRVKAVVIEDCLIYHLKKTDYYQVRDSNRDFDRFFHSQRSRRIRRAVHYQPASNSMMRSVKSVMSNNVLSVTSTDTISSTAQLMNEHRFSTVLVIDQGKLTGIVTDRDFRSRAVALGLSAQAPVSEVMTPEPVCIDEQASLFDATLIMTRQGCHHLPATRAERVVGMITVSDLMLARQDEPVYLVQHLSRQDDVEGLRNTVQALPNLLVEWVGVGMRASQVSYILTAISDAVTQRLIELAIKEFGSPPVPFCWLGFGSQGRSEQLIGADQDNGLLISDNMQDSDRPWFEQLAHYVCDGLNHCGYVYCPGKVMASTEQWRQPLSVWLSTVDKWTQTPTADAVMRVSIFFDIRTVYGDQSLCQKLQQHMLDRAGKNTIFLAALAENVLQHKPPLGVFRRFLVERNGEHQNTLDLKKRGVIPIIDIMRIHALANGVTAVNTQERIKKLAEKKILTIGDSRNLRDAFEFIMQLRVQAQAEQIAKGENASNYYNPKSLADTSRSHLRDAFTVVHESQEVLRQVYRGGL